MKNYLTLIVLLMFTLSCGMPSSSEKSSAGFPASSETSDSTEATGTDKVDDSKSSVGFQKIKAEILGPKCISCHSFVDNEAGLSRWIVAGKPEDSKFFVKTENGEMPKNGSPLTTKELDLIRDYIENMNPSTAPSAAYIDDGNKGISFTDLKVNILEPNNCLTCHNIGSEKELEDWIKSDPIESEIYTMTKSGRMPKGGSPLTKKDQAYLLQYLKEFEARD